MRRDDLNSCGHRAIGAQIYGVAYYLGGWNAIGVALLCYLISWAFDAVCFYIANRFENEHI